VASRLPKSGKKGIGKASQSGIWRQERQEFSAVLKAADPGLENITSTLKALKVSEEAQSGMPLPATWW